MESSMEANNWQHDSMRESGPCVELEESLYRANLKVMAEMYEGVYLEEYLKKYGEDAY